VGEGDAVWQRAGVLGHVSDSTPLVIPYRSIRARGRTPGPKPNCACTALLRPLPSFFSRPKGRESKLVLHWTTLEANSRPELPTLGPFAPIFASGFDSRPNKSEISLDSRPLDETRIWLLPRTGETNSDLVVALSNFKFSNFKFVTRASNACADPLVQSGRALHDLRPLRLSERQRRHGWTLCAAPPPGTRCFAMSLRRARMCGVLDGRLM